jgi:hypothetical protein
MDFPLALPVRCRERRKRNWNDASALRMFRLVRPVEIGFVPNTA